MTEKIRLGELIRRRRTERKMTQAQLAKLIGVKSDSYISKIERGEQRGSYERLAFISVVLKIPWKEMLDTGQVHIPELFGTLPQDDSLFSVIDYRFKSYHPTLKLALCEIAEVIEKYIFPPGEKEA